jgi:hypothetical protein
MHDATDPWSRQCAVALIWGKQLMKHPYAVGRILDHFPGLNPEDVAWRLRQSTFVSVRKRYMYFEVLKAASTQMIELLRAVENAPPMKVFVEGQQETRRDQFIHARKNVPLPSLAHLDDRTQREVLESPDFLRITVVRNPYTRLVSAWRNKVFLCEPQGIEVYLQIKGGMPGLHEKSLVSFKEFVDYLESKCDLSTCDPHWRRQVDHTFFPALNFSCVARVEKLGEGLRPFAQHLGLSESLIAAGKNESLPVATASYSEELAEKVYSLYQADFEVLGYDRNTWAAGRQNASRQPINGSASISEEKLIDEIIERNLIILNLYEERDKLHTLLKWVLRLHLPPVINGLVALHSLSRKAAQKIKGSALRVLRLHSQVQIFP